jgi:rhamnosyl/mannosyltransferase
LAEFQVTKGFDVTVLVCSRNGVRTYEEKLNGVKVIRAGRVCTAASMPISFSQPWLLAKLKPDIVHIQSPYPLGELSNYLLSNRCPTVISYQADIVRQRRLLSVYRPFLRKILSRADRVIATSEKYLDTSIWLRRIRNKCVVIPIGIELEKFSAPVEYGERRNGPFRILFVGRLTYYKGLHSLIRAVHLIPDASLTVAGQGPYYSQWKELVLKLGIDKRVDFLGHVDDSHLVELYKNSDVFVLPSNARSEAFGIVLIEAMASSLACITTEIDSGNSWIVEDGVTGLVVPPGDPVALASALKKLKDNPQLRLMMGKAGRRRAEENFHLRDMASRITSVYEQLLAR